MSHDLEMKSKQSIKQGTIIHTEKPFVYSLSSKVRTENCDFCFRSSKLLKCSGCHYVYYCGRGCQKDAWSIHKLECKKLQRVAPRIIPDAARLLAKLIWTLNRGGGKIKSYYTDSNFRMYKDLMSHYPDLKQDQRRMEHFSSLCGVLFDFLGDDILPNSAELMGMYGRVCVNSFNICNEELQALGTGMYLGASVVDHSCKPNALAMFEGTTLHIRALEPILYLDWSKIFISYVDVLNTRKYRQEELQRIYYFLCGCPTCSKPEPCYVNGAACPNLNCDYSIDLENYRHKCPNCGEHLSEDFFTKFKEVSDISVLHLQNMEQCAYLDLSKLCLEKQRGVLHKFNSKYVKTLDTAFESSIHFEKFEDARTLGLELLEPYYEYYGKFHPLVGLLHLKLGKILLFLNNVYESLTQLKKAYEVLKITHGIKSTIFREELMPLLHQAGSENGE